MCRWANVSRSGFYEWLGRGPSATAVRRGEHAALVRFAFEHSDGTSGYRRVHAQLARWGDSFSKKVVGYAMSDHMRVEMFSDACRWPPGMWLSSSGRLFFHCGRGSQPTTPERRDDRAGLVWY